MTKPIWDDVYRQWVQPQPVACPCCRVCRMIATKEDKARCVHGGPYLGYIEMHETT